MTATNYTQVSNDFIENYMDKCTGGEVKVFLAITRKTIGWHKTSDRISYSQLTEITGLSPKSLRESIKLLCDKKLIIQIKTKVGYVYDLAIEENNIVESTMEESNIVMFKSNTSMLESNTPAMFKSNTTKEITKETITKETINKKKHKYGEYNHVLLSDVEYEKLKNKFPDYLDKIRDMDEAIEMKGYKYKNHYLAILKWAKNDNSNQSNNSQTNESSLLDMLETVGGVRDE